MLLAQHYEVVAIDVIEEKVELLNNKKSPIEDAEIIELLSSHTVNFTANLDAVRAYIEAKFVIIATPTDYDP